MKKHARSLSFANAAVALSLGLGAAASAQDAKPGDAEPARRRSAMCIGCHSIPGYQASFPEVHKVPKIAGQNAKYIVAALTAYRKGDRKHPTMRGIAGTCPTRTSPTSPPTTSSSAGRSATARCAAGATRRQHAAAAAGRRAARARRNCASCHGSNFSKPIDPTYPKLAGQHADYLYAALKAYQTDNNPLVGRNNAIMMGMARPFTHAEIKAIAAYLGSLPGDLKTVQQPRFR